MTTHPIESYQYQGINDYDFQDEPSADFIDNQSFNVSLEMDDLNAAIAFASKFGFTNTDLQKAHKELTAVLKIYSNMHKEDVLPIQR